MLSLNESILVRLIVLLVSKTNSRCPSIRVCCIEGNVSKTLTGVLLAVFERLRSYLTSATLVANPTDCTNANIIENVVMNSYHSSQLNQDTTKPHIKKGDSISPLVLLCNYFSALYLTGTITTCLPAPSPSDAVSTRGSSRRAT